MSETAYSVNWSKADRTNNDPYYIQATATIYCGGFLSYLDAYRFAMSLAKREDFIRCSIATE